MIFNHLLHGHRNEMQNVLLQLTETETDNREKNIKNKQQVIVVEMEYKKEILLPNKNFNQGDYLLIMLPGSEKISHVLRVEEIRHSDVKIKIIDTFSPFLYIEGIKNNM